MFDWLTFRTGTISIRLVLEIAEPGSYHIFVSGHQAKGYVSFARIPGEQE